MIVSIYREFENIVIESLQFQRYARSLGKNFGEL